jgi:CheY-like chemotaxis protein
MSSKRILIVEDNEQNAGHFTRWLKADGYETARASAASDARALAASFSPDVALLDLQIPSEPGRADENVEHGFAVIDALLQGDPFLPVVVITAHGDRELTRRVIQRTKGGELVFKDADDLERETLKAVAVALAHPAYGMSRTVRAFRTLIGQAKPEDEYRRFIHQHWQVILGPEYRECQSPYDVARGAKIDLMAVRHDGFPDLWELKRPDQPVFEEYNQWLHHSRECARAIGQLMEYYDLARLERSDGGRSYDARRGVSVQLNRPRGFIVIGRYDGDTEKGRQQRERLRLENSFLSGLTILTYDDLIERAEQFLDFLQRARNGHGADVRR